MSLTWIGITILFGWSSGFLWNCLGFFADPFMLLDMRPIIVDEDPTTETIKAENFRLIIFAIWVICFGISLWGVTMQQSHAL